MLDPWYIRDSDRRVLRQSTLGTADTCHKRLEYELDPTIPYGTSEDRIVGTAVHAGIEHYYVKRQELEFVAPEKVVIPDEPTKAIVEAARKAFKAEIEKAGGDVAWEDTEAAAWKRVEFFLGLYFPDLVWPLHFHVVGVETEIFAPINDGWMMKGTIDLVLRDPAPGGGHVLVDDKTSRKGWRKGKETARSTNQAAWYSYWWPQVWKAATGEKLSSVRFVFDIMSEAKGGTVERRPAPVSETDTALVLMKAEAVMHLIEQNGPFLPNTTSFLCDSRWCDHWYRCPWGEAMSTGVLPPELTETAVEL